MSLATAQIDTPVGPFTLTFRGDVLCAAALAPAPADAILAPLPPQIADPLAAYWAGDLEAIDAIAVDPKGTPFQAEVWRALRRIPAGTTISYTELADRVGSPGASRAVGSANGANPVCIVIPCHRVIGADGTPRGYAYGIDRKLALLTHEGVSRLQPCRSPTPRGASLAAGSSPARDLRSPSAARP